MKSFPKAIAAIMLMTAVFFTPKTINAQTYNGHEYVDLGLPSGTLWATCNVGANSPEEYGDYYAWGETEAKANYNLGAYKYINSDYEKLTKYCSISDYGYNGFTDNLTVLQPSDDAATANWGDGWCMPTEEQWKELVENTSYTCTTRNGVNGGLFTASNGSSLFLPAAGTHWEDGLKSVGLYGRYWLNSLSRDSNFRPWYFSFRSDCYDEELVFHCFRFNGLSVRAVRSAPQN